MTTQGLEHLTTESLSNDVKRHPTTEIPGTTSSYKETVTKDHFSSTDESTLSSGIAGGNLDEENTEKVTQLSPGPVRGDKVPTKTTSTSGISGDNIIFPDALGKMFSSLPFVKLAPIF